VEAVEAAVEIQRELAGDPTLRVGLHMGDIAYDVQGAYGDAVNIAARLEALCPPGGVMISQKIYDDIRRHPSFAIADRSGYIVWAIHHILPIMAEASWLQEDAAAGARSLLRGAESLESIPLTFDAARLRRQRAGRLAEIGDLEGAAEELRRVHEIFLRLGASPELHKTRGQFDEIGLQPPSLA
jgi:hypothetical protein